MLVSKFDNIPDSNAYGYHPRCYSSYTNLKSLEKFPELEVSSEKRRSIRDKNATGLFYYFIISYFVNSFVSQLPLFLCRLVFNCKV